jgi:superfamily II DNA or RNA helicase
LVVLHTEPRAAEKLAGFTNARDPWIVAVNMVSEGVDIPRLRVGVYASAAKTPLMFRQIAGRFVRTIPQRPPEPSWLYIPRTPSCATTPPSSAGAPARPANTAR